MKQIIKIVSDGKELPAVLIRDLIQYGLTKEQLKQFSRELDRYEDDMLNYLSLIKCLIRFLSDTCTLTCYICNSATYMVHSVSYPIFN